MTFEALQDGDGPSSPVPGPHLRDLCARVEAYYAARLTRYGATPLGVDWSCTATQWLRFVQLLKICPFDAPFSLIDLGCGYGALAEFIAERHVSARIDYLGIDLSPAMIRRARRRHRGNRAVRFAVGRSRPEQADYAVASGIMNVRLGVPVPEWESFVRTMLLDLHCMSRRGFAVNFLTVPGADTPPCQLYCPDPATWVQYCRNELGCAVEVLDSYGMREVTLLVRHNDAPVGPHRAAGHRPAHERGRRPAVRMKSLSSSPSPR